MKTKEFLGGLWAKLRASRYDKLVMIAAPCVVLLICALVFVPRLFSADSQAGELTQTDQIYEAAGVPLTPPPPPAAPAVSTPAPAADMKTLSAAEGGDVVTYLKASSSQKDLYITVYREDGSPAAGTVFTLDVTFPNGQTYSYKSETDGSCYLVKLSGGEYTVAMQAQSGYVTPEPISCTVKERIEHKQIEDIEDIVDVLDVAEAPVDEVKTPDPYAEDDAVVPEDLGSALVPEDPYVEEITKEVPLLDENGHQTYTYVVHTGPNGYILYRDSGEESNVIPVDEDEDGNVDFGTYFVVPETPEEGSESNLSANGYYMSVELFNEDNTPVDEYYIDATPIMQTVTTSSGSSGGGVTVGWQERDGRMYYYDEDGEPVKGLKKIDGRIYYFDPNGAKARSVGVDVSFYNESVNWDALKAQGIDFAIIRVGGRTWQSGSLYGDTRTSQYLAGAKNAGLKVGVYFYSTAIDEVEAVQEASVALSTINGASLDYPIFFDTEYSGIYPEGRADNLSMAERSNIIRAFCETIENSGYRAGVYSGEYFMKNNLDYGVISKYQVWLASYTNDNKLPNFNRSYNIWQFTDKGQIDGVAGYVDMNVIF